MRFPSIVGKPDGSSMTGSLLVCYSMASAMTEVVTFPNREGSN